MFAAGWQHLSINTRRPQATLLIRIAVHMHGESSKIIKKQCTADHRTELKIENIYGT